MSHQYYFHESSTSQARWTARISFNPISRQPIDSVSMPATATKIESNGPTAYTNAPVKISVEMHRILTQGLSFKRISTINDWMLKQISPEKSELGQYAISALFTQYA